MDSIFISYRREDSADVSGRINDRLIQRFGKEAIFTDVDSIPLGVNFRDYIDKQVGKCEILLAVIGRDWLSIAGRDSRPRIEDPSDFVRIEIESALQRNIPVIPLLVRNAAMPAEDDLPASLKELAFRNGTPIRPNPDFHGDMDRLIKGIEKDLKLQGQTESKQKPKDENQDHGEPEAKSLADVEKQHHTLVDAISETEGEKHQEPGTQAKRWKNPLTFAMLALTTGLLFWQFQDRIFPPSYNPESLRLGIYIKNGWDTQGAGDAFSDLIEQLNINFADEFSGEDIPAYKFLEQDVATYTSINLMESALKSGEVDIVGELSPYLIFKIGEKLNTTPIISPQYFGPNYASVIFARDSAEFIRGNGENIDTDKSWRAFLKLLRESKDAKVAVAGQDSTSGYWYPRKLLLQSVGDKKSFDELAVSMTGGAEKIRNAVCNGSQSVIAGTIAKFRFEGDEFGNRCPDGSRLVKLKEFGIIPHGSFIARRELYDAIVEHDRLPRLQQRWSEAVKELFKSARGESESSVAKFEEYFPKTWEGRKPESYYSEARDVFTYADKKADRKSQREKLLLLIATSILLLGALAYLKLQRAERA